MIRKFTFALTALAVLGACAGPREMTPEPAPVPAPQVSEPELIISPLFEFASCRMLTITVEDPDTPFEVGVAPKTLQHLIVAEFPTTPAEMQRGLQGRKPLHPDTAMIFEFRGDHNPVLWMKDTPASLDMVFIDAKGDVFYLEAGTEPNSTGFLTPEEPDPVATHVLELPAGKAEEMGIFPGMSQIEVGEPLACGAFLPDAAFS